MTAGPVTKGGKMLEGMQVYVQRYGTRPTSSISCEGWVKETTDVRQEDELANVFMVISQRTYTLLRTYSLERSSA